MNYGTVCAIISITCVLVFFLLNYLSPATPNWLIFIVCGLAIAVAGGIMNKNKQ